MLGNKQEQTHTQILFDLWSHSQYMQNVVLLCGGCLCCGLHMLCFDVRHWFRSSCRLAAVRRWRWTGHRCIGIERWWKMSIQVVGLMICLCRYKVLLLKPHLRDMLASARRRRAIRCYSMLFVGFSSWSDVWYLQVMSLENFTHAFAWNDWNVILLTKMRWAGCEGSFTFSKPPQSIAKRQGFWGFVGLEWWSQWGNLWQQLDLLSQSFCDKLKNVQPESCSRTAELGSNMFPDSAWQARALYLQMTCRIQMRKTMRRASSCRFFLVLFGWLACDALAGTARNLVPACRLWQGDVDKSRWHSPEAHGACCELFWHLPDMWQTCGGRARSFAFSEAS